MWDFRWKCQRTSHASKRRNPEPPPADPPPQARFVFNCRAIIGLLGPILLVAAIVGIAGVTSLVNRKRARGIALLGASVFLLACGILLLQSWNRVMMRVNQTSQPAEAAR